jgi:hypothetical protein
VIKRDSDCPLCGAKLTPGELLDACGELLSPELGVLAARCPHCQGYIEVRPTPGSLLIGYLKDGATPIFETLITLPCADLEIRLNAAPARLTATLSGRSWAFTE